jgi:hypothetical protein
VVFGTALTLLSAPSTGEVPKTKRRLIRELLEMSGSDQLAGQMSLAILADIQETYPQMMEFVISEHAELDDIEKTRLAAELESFDDFAVKFRARFDERMKISEVVDAVYIPLYDEYFTKEDLEQMVAFYSTPVGQKAISRMPVLMQEALSGVYRAVQPQVVGLIQEIVEDEVKALAD